MVRKTHAECRACFRRRPHASPRHDALVCVSASAERQQGGKGEATFDFLGFTFYWARARTGRWCMWCKTRRASLSRGTKSIYDWCRSHRHLPPQVQRRALARRVRGHYNYFGVGDNFRSLLNFADAVRAAWYKWLSRRSQRNRLTWERYTQLLKQRWALPQPRIAVRIWVVRNHRVLRFDLSDGRSMGIRIFKL